MKRGIKDKDTKHCVHLARIVAQIVEDHDHCVMISIRDPGQEMPRFASNYRDVLALEFSDVSETAPHMIARIGMHDPYERVVTAPNESHAKAIAEFIRKHWEEHIIVHCEAGVSRSAAVCEALVRLGWGYKKYNSFGRMHANPLLLRYLCAEFNLVPMEAGGWPA